SQTPLVLRRAAGPGRRIWWLANPPLFDRHAGRRDHGHGAARRVALDVHRDRVHRDMRRCDLDMDGEGGAVAAEALRADAEAVDGLAQLGLELRALGIGAERAERPRRR